MANISDPRGEFWYSPSQPDTVPTSALLMTPKRKRTSVLPTSVPKPSWTNSNDDDESKDDTGGNDGGKIESNNGKASAAASPSVTLSNLEVLDCKICFEPLTVPVYQCVNGHIACAPCCSKLKNKCPSCRWKIGKNRCRAIEEVIKSVKATCCYANYGCEAVISYCLKLEHEKTCSFSPYMCPFSGCSFRCTAPKLTQHLGTEHSDSVIGFSFNCLFSVPARWKWNYNKIGEFIVLREESDGVMFVMERDDGALNIECVESSADKGNYNYDIVIRNQTGALRSQSSTKCIEGEIGNPRGSPTCFRLPAGLYSSDVNIGLCIWSRSASHPDITEGM